MKHAQIRNAVFVFIIFIVVFYLFIHNKKESIIQNTATTTETIQLPTGEATSIKGDGYTVDRVINNTADVKAPSLTHESVVKKELPKESVVILKKDIAATQAVLAKDPRNVQGWVDLGVNYKIIGDYEAARDVWEYAAKLSPTWVVPYINLGDLYHYYLKDYQKSENDWKKAISLKPDEVDTYIELSKLYQFSYLSKKDQADDVLLEGIRNNPASIDLRVQLALYYKTIGATENARAQYQKAHDLSLKMGDIGRARLLQEEINNL